MARLIATLIVAALFALAPVQPAAASAAQAYDLGQATVEQAQWRCCCMARVGSDRGLTGL